MALNPIVYTDKIVRSFLKYQLRTYPFADPQKFQEYGLPPVDKGLFMPCKLIEHDVS
jgi:hypothetical protein